MCGEAFWNERFEEHLDSGPSGICQETELPVYCGLDKVGCQVFDYDAVLLVVGVGCRMMDESHYNIQRG